MKNAFYLLVGIVFILGSVYMFFQKPVPQEFQMGGPVVVLDNHVIHVDVADTQTKRNTGLSGRRFLSRNSGMLFVFESPTTPSFWMKDMNFPIDIVWIDKGWSVVGVERRVDPDTFPQIFVPSTDISYVLEVNAGQADAWGIDTGTSLSFNP